jgi:hypothetical protein
MGVDDAESRRAHHERPDDPEDDLTPPAMWPEEWGGFDTDPFSPVGPSQGSWTTTRRRPRSRAGRWFVGILCVVIAVAFIAAQVAH